MAKDDVIELEGIVVDALPNAMFSVDIGGGHTILAHISGKLRMNFIKILPGDKVTRRRPPASWIAAPRCSSRKRAEFALTNGLTGGT